jgi:intracellular sulfur oxidation DsrE/DsrF family protein
MPRRPHSAGTGSRRGTRRTADGFGQALLYVNNYLAQNRSAYGVGDSDLAVVIVARHHSTPFALNDAMWAKHGAGLTQLTGFNDPNTKQPPAANIYNAPAYGATFLNRGVMLDGLLKRGVHLAVCEIGVATAASMIASGEGGEIPAIVAELTANRLANSQMVPAGIVTLNRAQERGYAFTYAAGI